MKKILFSAMLTASMAVQAQDTYLNYTLTQTSDLFGSARHVGMGGATGALGADLSSISLNPAGIGMFRRSDVSLTAGFVRQADTKGVSSSNALHGSFDQIGAVFAFPMNPDGMKYVNFALNYQRKGDFKHTFIADQPNAGGLSLSYQMANMCSRYADGDRMPSALSQALFDAGVIYRADRGFDGQPTNTGGGAFSGNQFQSISEGALHSFDFNLSGNYADRYYWGITIGVDYINYTNSCYYTEFCGTEDQPYDFDADSWKKITGVGANVKLGFIARPIEYSPLKVGFTIETPTFYSFKMDAQLDVTSHTDADNPDEWYEDRATYSIDSYLDYNLRSPWRFRASLGYTVGNWLALGADYEYALYNREKVSYTNDSYWADSWNDGEADHALNDFTSETLKGVHGLRIGGEARVGGGLSVRAGYNYYSKAHRDDAFLAHNASATTMDVATTAHYMNLSEVNILTLGLGFKAKHAYLDIAYKYRAQSGQFYAFDDIDLKPVNVDLDRHQMFFTLGYKF